MLKVTRTALTIAISAVLLANTAQCREPLKLTAPDWLTQIASQPVQNIPSDAKAVVLFDHVTVTVLNADEYVKTYRRVVKILRPEGRDEAHLATNYTSGEKVLSIHAWTIDRSGLVYEITDKDFTEIMPNYGVLYDDTRLRAADAAAPNPGSVIAFEYQEKRRAWFNELHWTYQENIPVREAHFTLELPAGWEYKTSSSGAQTEPQRVTDNQWEWVKRDIPGIDDDETYMPAPQALAERMEITYFGPGTTDKLASTWESIGAWYSNLARDRHVATPEIAQRTHELIAGSTDFDAKVKALTQFMQSQIRYVAIEIGIGGWQPHPASSVFRSRYGDCKDKATLLITMLREAGIPAHYLIVDTYRGVAKPELPSTWFNHMITAIELPPSVKDGAYRSIARDKSGKRYLIFDPTDEYTPVGELNAHLQAGYGLLVQDGGGEILWLPLLPPDDSLLVRTGKFSLAPDGTLAGEITEDRTGHLAWGERASLLDVNEQQRSKRLEHWFSNAMKGSVLESANVEHLDDPAHDLVLHFKMNAPSYGQTMGSLMLVRARVLGEKGPRLRDWQKRRYPVAFRGTSRERDEYEIEIPAGYTVDDIPNPVKIDNEFASYTSHIDVDGSKLRYTREYVVKNILLEPNQFDTLRKMQGIIGADEQAAVVLKKTP